MNNPAKILLGYITVNTALTIATHLQASSGKAEPPPDTVSIVLPAWYEETSIVLKSITSLKNQNIIQQHPSYFETILVGYGELEALSPYVDKVIYTPPGKLTARHIGILASKGNIIVAVDSDTIYPRNWLNTMLKPFRNPSVVAVTSRSSWLTLEPLTHLPVNLYYMGKILGRGSLIRKDAYFKAGGFNLNINQQDWKQVEQEEEYSFKKRLEKIGKVVYIDIPHYTTWRPSTPQRVSGRR